MLKWSMSEFLSNKNDIKRWLDKYKIKNYIINDDLSVDANGDIDISNQDLEVIPVKFGKVTGSFWCSHNKLINLEGAPEFVSGNFFCDGNKLTNLTGISKSIRYIIICVDNPLTSLIEIKNGIFRGIVFNIDEKNFKQKNLIQILNKYYNKERKYYNLIYDDFNNIVKPLIEKQELQYKINKARLENDKNIKNNFI